MILEDRTLRDEIDKLITIGINKGKLHRSTVVHLLSGRKAIEDYENVMAYMNSAGVNFVDDEIEEITEDKEQASFYQPFDSTKINIAQKPLSVEGIVSRLKYGEIDMKTKFQRKSGLWDDTTKSQLIESLMLRIPLPVFYFDGTKDDEWLVIDGLQRLSTFKEFFIDKSLKLTGLEYFSDYNGCTVDELPRTYFRRMSETQLTLHVIQNGTPENVKFNIFKRINTPGLKLENQEIRHALFQGKSTELLRQLAESTEFFNVTCVSNERMLASEVVLRYLAFKELKVEKYIASDGRLDDFLNEAMKTINKYSEERIQVIKDEYLSTLNRAYQIFGPFSFRKMSDPFNSRRNPFNVSLYEAWMLNLSELDVNEFNSLLERKNVLLVKFVDKLNDKTFGYDISSAKKVAVDRRIKTIKKMIRDVLND